MTSPGCEAGWRERIPADLAALADAWAKPDAWAGMTRIAGQDQPAEIVGIVVTDELVVHGWDVARATGQPYSAEPELLDAARTFLGLFASPDAPAGPEVTFGPSRPVADDSPPLDRVLALARRDPPGPRAHLPTANDRRGPQPPGAGARAAVARIGSWPARLSSKVVIVTGGSTGIGRAVAGRVVSDGGAVVIAGRRRDAGEQAAARAARGRRPRRCSSPPTSRWSATPSGWSRRPWPSSACWTARLTTRAA